MKLNQSSFKVHFGLSRLIPNYFSEIFDTGDLEMTTLPNTS